MRGGGKHKDKKGKEEKKQVVQLDDGMCAMACEQMRQVMETLRTSADKSTDEDKRCLVEAIVGLRKQARGEDLQSVADLEEGLKKLEEEMQPWSVEEQEQRRQKEQRRQEEQEHAAMRNAATSARTAAKTTAVTSATPGARDKNTDDTRKGKG